MSSWGTNLSRAPLAPNSGGAISPVPVRSPVSSTMGSTPLYGNLNNNINPIQSSTMGSAPLYGSRPLQNPIIQAPLPNGGLPNRTPNTGPIQPPGGVPGVGMNPSTPTNQAIQPSAGTTSRQAPASTVLGGSSTVNPATVAPNPNTTSNTSTVSNNSNVPGPPNYQTFQAPAMTEAQATQGGNAVGSYIYNSNLQAMEQQANQWNANLPAGDTNYASVNPQEFAQWWNSFSNGAGLGEAPAQNFWTNAPYNATTEAIANAGTVGEQAWEQAGQAVNTQGGAFGTPNPNWQQPQPGQNPQSSNLGSNQNQANYLSQLQQLFSPNYQAQQASPLGYTSWNQTNPFYSNGNSNAISTNNANPNSNSYMSLLASLLGTNNIPTQGTSYGNGTTAGMFMPNASNAYSGVAGNINPSQGNGSLQALLSLLTGGGMSALTGQQNTGQYL